MPTMRYLFLGVTLACFVGGRLSVTDHEFQDLSDTVKSQALVIDQLGLMLTEQASMTKEQASMISDQASVIREQASIIQQLQETTKAMTERMEKLELAIDPQQELPQNFTIEERVELLEIQVVEIEADVADLDQDVNFLFDEQVIQDERLLNLEEDTDQINEQLVQVDEDIEGLQVTTLELDFRVTELEENGGSGGNSSISELEERVETLEGTAADQETRLTAAETEIEDLGGTVADHETRLTTAEENIQGLQMTDINHESRISALEENGGGGSGSHNETIAFHAVLTSYGNIPDETVVEFNEVVLNEGNGYDSSTGVFTVPGGGDGLYYFSTYLLIQAGEYAQFDIQLNDDVICSARGEHETSGSGDTIPATCSAVVSLVEGDEVKLVLRAFTDNTPLYLSTIYYYTGFNGFRI